MSSEAIMIPEQCCFQEWAAQIRDYQNRSADISVVGWRGGVGVDPRLDISLKRMLHPCHKRNIPASTDFSPRGDADCSMICHLL